MTPPPVAHAPHIFLSCGEASGDRYGAALVAALRRRRPDLRLTALGGPALEAAGARIIQSSGPLAVMGFGEVLGALPRLLAARRRVWRHLSRGEIDLCVPVDFPGFNLRVAAAARQRGIPVFYLVAPQLWAWGAWRLRGLRRAVDRLGVILPFEPDWFGERGIDVVALGHPLVEDYPAASAGAHSDRRAARLGAPDAPLTLGLLPGSRRQEVARLLPELLGAAALLRARLAPRPLTCVVSAAPGLERSLLESAARRGATISSAPLPDLLPTLDLALVCSGTASLEVALAGVPHEVVYRTSAFSYAVARRLVRVPHIGLANLILAEDFVREHIQAEVTPAALAAALGDWLEDAARRHRFAAGVDRLRTRLGPPGAWERAADVALALLDARVAAARREGVRMVRAGHPALQGWKLRLASPAWRLLVLAVPVRPRPAMRPTHPGPVIYACLHRDLIPAMLYVRPSRPVLLVSQSADGEVLISALGPHGFGFARGSTGHGGGPAFMRLLAALREGRSVGVAVDGPRGPFGAVREGVVQLSRLSGRPVVPLRAHPRHCWRLRTWDGTLVPWPGAVARIDEGSPLQVPPEEDPARTPLWSARIAAALTEGR